MKALLFALLLTAAAAEVQFIEDDQKMKEFLKKNQGQIVKIGGYGGGIDDEHIEKLATNVLEQIENLSPRPTLLAYDGDKPSDKNFIGIFATLMAKKQMKMKFVTQLFYNNGMDVEPQKDGIKDAWNKLGLSSYEVHVHLMKDTGYPEVWQDEEGNKKDKKTVDTESKNDWKKEVPQGEEWQYLGKDHRKFWQSLAGPEGKWPSEGEASENEKLWSKRWDSRSCHLGVINQKLFKFKHAFYLGGGNISVCELFNYGGDVNFHVADVTREKGTQHSPLVDQSKIEKLFELQKFSKISGLKYEVIANDGQGGIEMKEIVVGKVKKEEVKEEKTEEEKTEEEKKKSKESNVFEFTAFAMISLMMIYI